MSVRKLCASTLLASTPRPTARKRKQHATLLPPQVFICARSADDVAAAVAELQAAGHSARGAPADVSSRAGCEALVASVSEAFGGRLDILINNVGTNIRKPTVNFTAEELDLILATNLKSAYALCQLAHPLLKAGAAARGDGGGGGAGGVAPGSAGASVVFNSSVAGGPLSMFSGTPYAMVRVVVLGVEVAGASGRPLPVFGCVHSSLL